MAARRWLLATLLGAGLIGSACALILGAEDLPEGSGGSGSTGTATSTATTSTAATSGSHAASSSTSSTGGGDCSQQTTCTGCAICMEDGGPCNLADAGCTDPTCTGYIMCMTECTVMDGGPQACMMGCGAPPQPYPTVMKCLCMQCQNPCKQQMCG